MAQDRLIIAASGVVLVGGAAAEVAAPGATTLLTFGDYVAGASLALAAAALARARPRSAMLALIAAALWFLATLSGAQEGAAAAVGTAVLLLYRGPLLQLLLALPDGHLHGGPARVLAACAYVGCLLPVGAAGPVTTAAALGVGFSAAVQARSAPADRRRPLAVASAVAVALAVVWLLASTGVGDATALLVATDGLLVAVAALAYGTRAGGLRGAVTALVVDLGPERGEQAPVVARLARVLGDPDLRLRFELPGLGWVDEDGRPVAAPEGDAATRAALPGGGEVALLHGTTSIHEPDLARAAARAAALAMDTTRLNAEARRQAAAVRASRARLLTAADVERRALEDRLSRGPIRRLERVDAALAGLRAPGVSAIRDEVTTARSDLATLAAGLVPALVAGGDLGEALDGIAQRAPVPVDVELGGDPAVLGEALRAAVYFVVSEALSNVAKYAGATHASVAVHLGAEALTIRVGDDGVGGAVLIPKRGLAGLADRVRSLGGRFELSSPPGGPTVVTARLPR